MRATDFKRLNERPTDLIRITLTEKDGSETIIHLDEDLHYFFVFSKADPKKDRYVPLEILIKGDVDVVSEMFYQLGEAHPSLIEHCAKRALAKTLEQLKAKSVDPGEEAFKVAPVVGGIQ
jgi:hypothetical protein